MNPKQLLEKDCSIQKFAETYGGTDQEIIRETYKMLAFAAWLDLIKEAAKDEAAKPS